MPVQYNLPAASQLWTQQEVDRYNKLPFYLAAQQAKYFPEWNVWNKLLGTTKWQPNMGNTMRGVIAEPSPLQRQTFYPNALTTAAAKDRISHFERTNEAILFHHKFESPQINFLSSFTDFRTKQLNFAIKDINRQIAFADDIFARTYLFDLSPHIFISGKAVDGDGNWEVIPAPSGLSNNARTTFKSTAWLQAQIAKIGTEKGNLSFKVLNKLCQIFSQDLQAPAFEGMANTPKDNETIKGRYVFVGSEEAWTQLSFDEHILAHKDDKMNLLNDEFKGVLFGKLAYKTERFPIRLKADGTMPPPQLMEASADAPNQYETVPNPDYVNAPFEIGHIMAANPYDKLTVGAPPAEFASGKMSESKFNKLFWNGEVRITDNVLVEVANDVVDTNKYGEVLQLISHLALGIIPVNKRFAMPVLYKRYRVSTS